MINLLLLVQLCKVNHKSVSSIFKYACLLFVVYVIKHFVVSIGFLYKIRLIVLVLLNRPKVLVFTDRDQLEIWKNIIVRSLFEKDLLDERIGLNVV